ncbi:MAG: hypothetical protein SNG96_04865 [Rikenellaceae bacterium]
MRLRLGGRNDGLVGGRNDGLVGGRNDGLVGGRNNDFAKPAITKQQKSYFTLKWKISVSLSM